MEKLLVMLTPPWFIDKNFSAVGRFKIFPLGVFSLNVHGLRLKMSC